MLTDTLRPSLPRLSAARRALLGRASVLAAVSCLTVGLAVAEPLLSTAPVAAKKKGGGKTITRTFASPAAVVINDDTTANPYPATINVSGIKKGKVKDVNVTLRGFNHGFPDNVDVVLVAPNGAMSVLMSDVGGSTDAASLTLTIDDEAAGALPGAGPLVSGAFRPLNDDLVADPYPALTSSAVTANLAQLDGGNPNGAWQLYVVDDSATNVGAFSGGWDLELTAQLKKKKHGKH